MDPLAPPSRIHDHAETSVPPRKVRGPHRYPKPSNRRTPTMRWILPCTAALVLAACTNTPEASPDASFTVAEASTVNLAVTGMT